MLPFERPEILVGEPLQVFGCHGGSFLANASRVERGVGVRVEVLEHAAGDEIAIVVDADHVITVVEQHDRGAFRADFLATGIRPTADW